MIDAIYLEATALTNNKRFCTAIRNLNFPEVDWSSSKKGGFYGRQLSEGKLVSNRFATEFQIVGDDFADLADQREEFIKLIGEIISGGGKLLKIDKANGTDLQVTVKGVDVSGDVSFADPLNASMLIEWETEKPVLESQTLSEEEAFIFSGGGTPVPMPIPLDMSVGGINELTISNGGNYPAFPVFTFQGPLLNPSLYNVTSDKLIQITYNLPTASDKIEIDTYTRICKFIPSNLPARQYVSGDFWVVELGTNIIHLGSGSVNPNGKCTITYRDTYIGI
jgi:hypothetical protein